MKTSAWTALFVVAAVAAVVVGVLIVAVGVLVVVDVRHVTGPSHVNDDGGGWMMVFGVLAMMVLVPLWAVLVASAVIIRRHSRQRPQPMSGERASNER